MSSEDSVAVLVERIDNFAKSSEILRDAHERHDDDRFAALGSTLARIEAKIDENAKASGRRHEASDARYEALTTRFWLLAVGVALLGSTAGAASGEIIRLVTGH